MSNRPGGYARKKWRALRPVLQLLGKLVLKLMVWRNRPERAPG